MSATDPNLIDAEYREARRALWFTRITKADIWLRVLGLAWITPLLRAAAGEDPRGQLKEIWRLLGIPVAAIVAFLAIWAVLAPTVQTSLGAVPGPAAVWHQAEALHEDAVAIGERRRSFEERVEARNQRLIDAGRGDDVTDIAYSGSPSYYQQSGPRSGPCSSAS